MGIDSFDSSQKYKEGGDDRLSHTVEIISILYAVALIFRSLFEDPFRIEHRSDFVEVCVADDVVTLSHYALRFDTRGSLRVVEGGRSMISDFVTLSPPRGS